MLSVKREQFVYLKNHVDLFVECWLEIRGRMVRWRDCERGSREGRSCLVKLVAWRNSLIALYNSTIYPVKKSLG